MNNNETIIMKYLVTAIQIYFLVEATKLFFKGVRYLIVNYIVPALQMIVSRPVEASKITSQQSWTDFI